MSNKENKKPIVRSNAAQIKYLIRYMAQNPMFAAGEYRGPLGATNQEKEWAELQRQLAELGPNRTIQQWKHELVEKIKEANELKIQELILKREALVIKKEKLELLKRK